MDAHELVQSVKSLALTLGRTPTRAEFAKQTRGGNYGIDRTFGTYAALLQAAGLDTYIDRRAQKKIGSEVFTRNLEAHLENYEPKKNIERKKPYPSIAVISDVHWPFCSKRVVDRFLEYVGDVKPTYVLLNGDAWDMYAHTRFPRSHNVFTPRQEEELSRQANLAFWAEAKRRAPEAICNQRMGNHDIRPLKRVLEVYPEAEDWIAEKLKTLFTFPGVTTEMDARQELLIDDDILVFHGYRSKLGDHRDYTMYNAINGHTHVGGVVFRKVRGGVLWEMNSGLAGDPEAKGLTYTPQKITNWTPGFGAIDALGPRFIHC